MQQYYFSETSSEEQSDIENLMEKRKVKRNKRHNVDETKWTAHANQKKRERGDVFLAKRK